MSRESLFKIFIYFFLRIFFDHPAFPPVVFTKLSNIVSLIIKRVMCLFLDESLGLGDGMLALRLSWVQTGSSQRRTEVAPEPEAPMLDDRKSIFVHREA